MSPVPRDLPLLLLGVCSCPPHPGVCPCPSQVSHLALPVDTDVIAVLPARGPVHHGRRPLRVEVEALGQAVEGTGLDTPWRRSQEEKRCGKPGGCPWRRDPDTGAGPLRGHCPGNVGWM